MSADVVNLLIAAWGALTGTIALTLSVLQYTVERPRIKLNWLRGFGILTEGVDGKLKDTNQRIARLIATNRGRQTIRIIGAYGVSLQADGSVKMFMFTDGLFENRGNKVLSPEQPSTEFQVDDTPYLDSIVFFGVNDGFGKTHALWLAPWYRRFSIKRRMKQSTRASKTRARELPN